MHSDAGLLLRVSIGCAVFVALAVVDYLRNKSKATRWREYVVLIAAVLIALLYGAINDQITVTISPEYFLYGKELFKTIGEKPELATLRWEAAKVGLKATWSAGLIFGVALLLANNPSKQMPRLKNRQLMKILYIMPLIAAVCGVVVGFAGYRGYLVPLSSDFRDMVDANVYRPYQFMATWGVHLGGYVGGVLGTAIAVAIVIHRRKRLITDDGARMTNLS